MGEKSTRYFEVINPKIVCKHDGYNNDWYSERGVPKRLMYDAETKKIRCTIRKDSFSPCKTCEGPKTKGRTIL
jgi:hypothetical protein